jgi:murein DD-endopeptidase MepM/ murein hydrolase activator NlpD
MSFRLLIVLAILVLAAPMLPQATIALAQQPDDLRDVAAFLDAQPGPLKTYREGDQTAAMLIVSSADYYGLSPRLYLALLEAASALLPKATPPPGSLVRPFFSPGPQGFAAQIDWASRELRAGLGPYATPPTLRFSDGTSVTLTLQQAPEGVAVQRFLAHGRTQPEWRAAVTGFNQAFQRYFNNQLPAPVAPSAAGPQGFLRLPWPDGVRVRHLAFFDHSFPTVDSGDDSNSVVIDYLGRGGVQYDGHDGHDYVFLDQPIGTPILAAAPGIAYARTVRGNGVVILHDGGFETVYWHLDEFAPLFKGRLNSDRGVYVNAGDLIGTSGRSGFVQGTPHLHFEVRVHGRQIDPYGWYGPGRDPCVQYSGCVAGAWLWHTSLRGRYDFTPPALAQPPDLEPPQATLTAQPRADLLLLARFDGHPVQQVGQGFAHVEGGGVEYRPSRAGQGASVPQGSGLSYQRAGNLAAAAGTIALWAELPASYPASSTGRSYLLATSANPEDPARIYTGTLSLRHEQVDGARQWNFWTIGDDGSRHDLRAPDTLAPGLHHFALRWDAGSGAKALFIDGRKVADAQGAALPLVLGERLELGRFTGAFGHSGVTLDELAVFGRALDDDELAALFTRAQPLEASSGTLRQGPLQIDVNALDNGGEIVAVQLGIDGVWQAPQPYYDSYSWRVPPVAGPITLGARFFDRANNSTVLSATLNIRPHSSYLPLLEAKQTFTPVHSSRNLGERQRLFLPVFTR